MKQLSYPKYPVNDERLRDELVTALGNKYQGHSTASREGVGTVTVNLVDEATPNDERICTETVNLHNPALLSTSQTQRKQEHNDLALIIPTAVSTSLTRLEASLTDIATDLVAINLADIAGMRQVVTRTLERQRGITEVLVKLIKANRWIASDAIKELSEFEPPRVGDSE